MLSKKKINGWAAVALVFLVCAVVYGLLSSYPRELAVYSDELRYLDAVSYTHLDVYKRQMQGWGREAAA